MKILLVIHSYLPNYFAGTEVYTYNLAQELARLGNEVKVFTVEPRTSFKKDTTERYFEGAVEVIKVHHPEAKQPQNLRETIWKDEYNKEFKAALDEYRPDVVHIQHLIGMSLEFINIVKARNIKVVYTAHDLWHRCPTLRAYVEDTPCLCKRHEACGLCSGMAIQSFIDYKKVDNPFVKLLLRLDWKTQRRKRNSTFLKQLEKVDLIVTPSQYLYNDIKQFGIKEFKVRMIQHGINLPPANLVGNKIDNGIVRFIFASHLTIDKGFGLAVQTFKELEKAGLKFKLDFYGSYAKEDSTITEFLEEISHTDQMSYQGTYKPENKYEVFSKYNVALVPSLWNEIYGLVLDEALALGKFALVSNKGALPERVIDGDNGLIFNANEPTDFKNKVVEIINNPAKYINSKEKSKTWQDLSSHAGKILACYQEVFRAGL